MEYEQIFVDKKEEDYKTQTKQKRYFNTNWGNEK